MAFNASACLNELVEIGEVIGVERGTREEVAAEAIRRTRDLCASVGIPRTLAALGLPKDKLDWVAEQSMLSARLINNNPRKLAVTDVKEIVSNAFHGLS
jgi:alcohol dehydrogenase